MKTLVIIVLSLLVLSSYSQEKMIVDKNTDIMNHLKLSMDEEDILYEIRLINNERISAETEYEYMTRRIEELKKIVKLSGKMEGIHSKAERKLEKYQEYRIGLKSSTEELTTIENQLIFNIYKNHLENPALKKKTKKSKKAQVYISKADSLFDAAEEILQFTVDTETDEEFIKTIEIANKRYTKAVDNQRQALAMHLNIDLAENVSKESIEPKEGIVLENNLASAETESNQSVVSSESAIIENEQIEPNLLAENTPIETNIFAETENKKTINTNLIFRVQVGAFINKITKDDIVGLSPIYFDKSDNLYSKAMVGKHHSFKSAQAALKVVKNNTEFKDAFIVAYLDGERKRICDVIQMPLNKDREDPVIYTSK